jgi:hypothetical protein
VYPAVPSVPIANKTKVGACLMPSKMTYQIVGRPIDKAEIYHDLDVVFLQISGKKPEDTHHDSSGNRYAWFTPSQARRLAYRLIEAASRVERKVDKHGLWKK